MPYTSIPSALYNVGKAIKRELFSSINTNLENHEERINAVEGGASSLVVFNQIIDLEAMPRAGEIRSYLLSSSRVSEFLSQEDWDILAGQSVAGKRLATYYGSTLPDARGEFLRSLDNGRGVDTSRALGNAQSDLVKAHNHTINHGHTIKTQVDSSGIYIFADEANRASTGANTRAGIVNDYAGSSGSNVGAENRPRNLAVNYAIKEDEDWSRLLIYRAPTGLSITSAVVSNLKAGASGTLEVDFQSGATLASLSSMLTTPLQLSSGVGDYGQSANASFSSSVISANQYMALKLNTLQSGQSKFFVSVIGEV